VASQPHQFIRDVVCSLVQGELPDISFVNPLAGE
jgi:hypothetical protein